MTEYAFDLRRRGVGDTLAVSGLIRDLFAQDPSVRVRIRGTLADECLQGVPGYVRSDQVDRAWTELDYRPTRDAARTDRSARFFYAAHDAFERATGGAVRRGPCRPFVVLSEEERARPYADPYAVVASGSKVDIPLKQFPTDTFRRVIGATLSWNWKQVGLVRDHRFAHRQSELPGAESLLGGTSLRELIRLIAHAEVVLCHLSLPFVVAAALGVPTVVLAGGRETPHMFEDSGAELLHTIGALPCCATGGCYKAAAVIGGSGNYPDSWLCTDPVATGPGQVLGRCVTLISPEDVVAALYRARALKRYPLPVTVD
jgi:hypothetical protein